MGSIPYENQSDRVRAGGDGFNAGFPALRGAANFASRDADTRQSKPPSLIIIECIDISLGLDARLSHESKGSEAQSRPLEQDTV